MEKPVRECGTVVNSLLSLNYILAGFVQESVAKVWCRASAEERNRDSVASPVSRPTISSYISLVGLLVLNGIVVIYCTVSVNRILFIVTRVVRSNNIEIGYNFTNYVAKNCCDLICFGLHVRPRACSEKLSRL